MGAKLWIMFAIMVGVRAGFGLVRGRLRLMVGLELKRALGLILGWGKN